VWRGVRGGRQVCVSALHEVCEVYITRVCRDSKQQTKILINTRRESRTTRRLQIRFGASRLFVPIIYSPAPLLDKQPGDMMSTGYVESCGRGGRLAREKVRDNVLRSLDVENVEVEILDLGDITRRMCSVSVG